MATILINNIHDLINLTKDSGLWGEDCVQMADIDMSVTDPTNVDLWDSGITYVYGDFVRFDDSGTVKTYAAKNIGGNINKSPDTEDTYWLECWATDEGWIPIALGASSPYFSGSYNGQEHIIENLYSNRDSTDYIGFFSRSNGTLENIFIKEAYIKGQDRVGGIAGNNNSMAVVSGGNVQAQIYGMTHVGGIIGTNSGDITNCYSESEIEASNERAGGIAGTDTGGINNSSSMSDTKAIERIAGGIVGLTSGCIGSGLYSGGTVHSSSTGGGIIGYALGGSEFYNSYSSAEVYITGSYAGGFVGRNVGIIEECYATGETTATSNYSGGFAGRNDVTINDCYARGNVSAGSYGGGFVGYINKGATRRCYSTGTADHGGFSGRTTTGGGYETVRCYWDKQSSGMNTDTTAEAVGINTTAEMQTLTTFTNWDFADILFDDTCYYPNPDNPSIEGTWYILTNDYPKLMWEEIEIPDVYDTEQSLGEQNIRCSGFVVGDIDEDYNNVVVAGNIYSQDPISGTLTTYGNIVDIIVSRGAFPAPDDKIPKGPTITFGPTLLRTVNLEYIERNLYYYGNPLILAMRHIQNSDIVGLEVSEIGYVVWGGIPLSVSGYWNRGANMGVKIFYALDIIETSFEINSSKDYNYFRWYGNLMSGSSSNNRNYMDVWLVSGQDIPSYPVILNGAPMATGSEHELIVNRTNYSLNDVDLDNNGNPIYFDLFIGGRPLSVARKNNRYYLVVNNVNR